MPILVLVVFFSFISNMVRRWGFLSNSILLIPRTQCQTLVLYILQQQITHSPAPPQCTSMTHTYTHHATDTHVQAWGEKRKASSVPPQGHPVAIFLFYYLISAMPYHLPPFSTTENIQAKASAKQWQLINTHTAAVHNTLVNFLNKISSTKPTQVFTPSFHLLQINQKLSSCNRKK